MARLVVASSPLYGNVVPMRAIAADLVRRGHRVTFLTGSLFREFVEGAGVTFAPLTGLADIDQRLWQELESQRVLIPPGLRQLAFDLRWIIDFMPSQHEALQRTLAQAGDEPVVLLAETAFFGAAPVLLGAPGIRPVGVVGIGIFPLMISSVDHAPFGLGLPPDSSAPGRARNRATNTAVQRQVFGATQAHFVDVLEGLGATQPPRFLLDNVVSLPDLFLQLTVAGLEYPRSDAPESLRYVGALPENTPPEAPRLPSWWGEVVEADRVVVVSQGTQANQDFSELVEPTLRALADLDVLVVATLRREAVLADVPANARVAEHIPFDALLPYADVVVSHGGYGGVQQSLGHGVPLVLAGLGADKAEVTARTAWTGAAIDLGISKWRGPDEIRAAVQTVLADPSYRRHAQRLRAEYADHDPFGEIAGAIDELLSVRQLSVRQR